MTVSDWITVSGIALGLFATTISTALFLTFKIGAVHEKVISIEKTLEKVTITLEKITSKKKFRSLK
ncbi:MAG TPA: hypothetical protein VFE50_10080 [Cyclobacteriaceae bacterium]|nr:hypothetical protein [Cyclobacteriaceae bacterium]